MRSVSYIFYNFFYKFVLKLYLRQDSSVTFDGFKLKILKGVFHPSLFFSTKYFYEFLKTKNLNKKHFLEIGSGSGILSMLACKKGAIVTAIDIDPKAVENTRLNFSKNFPVGVNVVIHQSDMFSDMPVKCFDFIVINPPYYFKKVQVPEQYAWYCGENGEYFESLFSGLKNYVNSSNEIYMILQEKCEIKRIEQIAAPYNFKLELSDQKLIKWEMNLIFKIVNR